MNRLVLFLVLACTVLVGATVLIARVQSEPNELATFGFSVCNGKPCFLGIAPDVTTWDSFTSGLRHEPNIQSYSEAGPENVSFFSDGLGVALTGQSSRPEITYVRVGIQPNQSVRVGDIVRLYGLPCAVAPEDAGKGLALYYPFMYVVTVPRSDHIDLNAHVDRIGLSDPSTDYPGISDWCEFAKKYSTPSGFTAVESYKSLGLRLNQQ